MPRTLDEIASDLTADPDFIKLPQDQQDTVFAELAKGTQPQSAQNMFESPAARVIFPGVGGVVGAAPSAILGGAATAPVGGVGAIPSAAAGGALGAASGESLRQFLASMTGGYKPKTVLEGFHSPSVAGLQELAGFGVASSLPIVGKAVGKAAKFTAENIGELLTGVPKQAIGRAIDQGASKVIKGEYLSGVVPGQLREKVISGLQKFRDSIETSYGEAMKTFKPELERTKINTGEIVNDFKKTLVDMKVVDPQGNPIPTMLPNEVVPNIGTTNKKLSTILQTLMNPENSNISAAKALQLKRELDTMLDFDPNEVRQITTQGQGAIFGLRTSIRNAIDAAVPEMKQVNQNYHVFRDTYDAVQPRLRDPNIEDTLRRLANTRNTFNLRELESINSQLGPEDQFLNQTLDFLAGAEFGKNPRWLRAVTLPFMGYRASGIPGAIAAELMAQPQTLGYALKGAEAMGRPISAAAGAVPQQSLPPTIAAIIRSMQNQNQQ